MMSWRRLPRFPAPLSLPTPVLFMGFRRDLPRRLFIAGAMMLSPLACLAAPLLPGPTTMPRLTAEDEHLLDDLERTAFQFFAEQAHPRTGLVRDRARADGSPSEGKASVAASGFSFGAWIIAAERGWVTRDAALERVRLKLRFFANEAPRVHGFFYHFLEMDTGARAWQCELSSIDSALLYSGLILAREYFQDEEVTALVNRLLGDVDWEWFRNGGQLVSLAWHDETGFSRYRWNRYSEHVLMSFLALGVSPRPLEAGYWQLWHRAPVGRYGDYVYLQEPPLFVNQFPQAFLDLRQMRDAHADYYHNTQLATLAQRQFSLDLRNEFPAWNENLWGLTASDSATGYKAWGGPPRTLRYNALDGTVVPCAAAGSLPFAPRETLDVLHHLRDVYGDRIWKRYGFVDAFNPHNGWVNPDVLGIDLGVSLLMAENLRTGLIWRLFMQAPEVKLALGKAGFLSTSRNLTIEHRAALVARARQDWQELQAEPASPGLQLTALISAQQLGLVTGDAFVAAARQSLAQPAPRGDATTVAEYAAALITLRQAYPLLAPEATQRLDALDWRHLPDPATHLGGASRLAVFLQVAAGVKPATAWTSLARTTEAVGPVQVLAPVNVGGALRPGLWLDERTILPGAAAAQLAYASLFGPYVAPDPMLRALQLEYFPRETARQDNAAGFDTPDATAAHLITAANLLANGAIRGAFQRDPLVQAGRAAIPEFAEAAFGALTSVYAQRELVGGPPVPPARIARVVRADLPRAQWDWHTVAGLEFKDSEADVRPGDAPLGFRFAVTWDEQALHFHAEVTDSPAGYTLPAVRNRFVELFIDPQNDGLVWTGAKDYQFTYRVGVGAKELFNRAPNQGVITETADGYTVEASIPWASLGLTPRAGLEFGLTPAAVSEGTKEWEAMLKVNWSYVVLRAGVHRLGVVRLE